MPAAKIPETCPACGGKTMAAEIGMPPEIRPAGSDNAVVRFAGVPVQLRVCAACGRLEIFAKDLDRFGQA
jgi:ribosomal protein S27AE